MESYGIVRRSKAFLGLTLIDLFVLRWKKKPRALAPTTSAASSGLSASYLIAEASTGPSGMTVWHT